MSTPVDTAPPAWERFENWPERLQAVPMNSQIGRLWYEASTNRQAAREKRGEAGRLSRDADGFDAVIQQATPATPWQDVAKAQAMAPIYRRAAARLAADAEPLEAEAAGIMQSVERLWAEYLAALAKWQRKPTAEHAAQLAAYVWPE